MPRTVIPPLFSDKLDFLRYSQTCQFRLLKTWSQELPLFFEVCQLCVITHNSLSLKNPNLFSAFSSNMNTPLPVTAPVWAMQLVWEMTTSYTGWWYAQECVWCKNVTILCLQSLKKLPFYFLACIWTNLNSLKCTTPEDLHATLETTTAIFLPRQSTIFLLNFLSLLILCWRSLKKLPFYFLLAHCPCTMCSWFAISKFQAKTLLMCVSSSNLYKNKSKCFCPWLKKKHMVWWCNWETDKQTDRDLKHNIFLFWP